MKNNNEKKTKIIEAPLFIKMQQLNDFLKSYKITAFNSPSQKAIDFINDKNKALIISMRPKIIKEITEENLNDVIQRTGQKT